MTRTVPEWIGKTDDEPVPARVKVRLFDACGKQCQACGRELIGRDRPEYDHIVALVNGGEHRESNLQVLCEWCHGKKTKADVAEKARVYRKRKTALGIRKPSKFACSRNSKFKKRVGGSVVLR